VGGPVGDTGAPDQEELPPGSGRAPLLVGLAGGLVLLLAGAGIAGYLLWGRGLGDSGPGDEEEASYNLPPLAAAAPRPLITLSPAEEKQVAEVTGRGVAFLKKRQDPHGFWPEQESRHRCGLSAMAGLTLLECGVKADDPVVQKAAAFVRGLCPSLNETYDLALAILFFDRLGDSQDRERIGQLALRLAAGQTPQGGWNYTCPVLSAPDQEELLEVLRDLRGEDRGTVLARHPGLSAKLRRLAVLQPTERRKGSYFRGGGDNSNTQFALLGLWTARRYDLPLEPSLALVARRFQLSQATDGSWAYRENRVASHYPTMTAAGLLGLAVGYGLELDQAKGKGQPGNARRRTPETDPSVQKALEVVAGYIGSARKDPKLPPPPLVQMYFLWSVERVAVLFRLETIKGKHWYQWGLDILTAHQNPDGHWHAHEGPGSGPVADTCFALLFLQRVNLAADLTDKLKELMEGPVWRDEAAAKE
jgi:hypothetical protein